VTGRFPRVRDVDMDAVRRVESMLAEMGCGRCPFCGEAYTEAALSLRGWTVLCYGCGREGPVSKTESGAAKEWRNLAQCKTCETVREEGGFGPSHNGSPLCRSGSIASGGTRAHCTCDTCF
jgi:hypothetical protein